MEPYQPATEPEWNADDRWPAHRLRTGWALVLFFVFETVVGRQLPATLTYSILALGVATLASAVYAIHRAD